MPYDAPNGILWSTLFHMVYLRAIYDLPLFQYEIRVSCQDCALQSTHPPFLVGGGGENESKAFPNEWPVQGMAIIVKEKESKTTKTTTQDSVQEVLFWILFVFCCGKLLDAGFVFRSVDCFNFANMSIWLLGLEILGRTGLEIVTPNRSSWLSERKSQQGEKRREQQDKGEMNEKKRRNKCQKKLLRGGGWYLWRPCSATSDHSPANATM